MGFTRRIDALNGIATCIGGDGGHDGLHGELKAWQEIAGIGLRYNPATDTNFISRLKGLKVVGSNYYLKDIVGNNDAQLVDSYALQFGVGGTSAYSDIAISDAYIINDKKNTYEFYKRLDDITVNPSGGNEFDKNVLWSNGGRFSAGIIIYYFENKLKIRLLNNAGVIEKTSTITVLNNTQYYYIKVEVDIPNKQINLQIGDQTESITYTTTGTDYTSTTAPRLGHTVTSAKFSISRFRKLNDDVVVCDIPFSQNHKNTIDYNVYCRITNTSCNTRGKLSLLSDSTYPTNILVGFEKWRQTASPNNVWHVPLKTDGSRIVTSITGYVSLGIFPSGDHHNLSEAKVEISSGIKKSYSELSETPCKKYLPKGFTTEKIDDIICFSSDKNETELNKILAYMEMAIQTAWIHVGDSISASNLIQPPISDLVGDIAYLVGSQPFAKTYNFITKQLETLTELNTDTGASGSTCFTVRLSHAYSFNNFIWICGFDLGGLFLQADELRHPTGCYMPLDNVESTPMVYTKQSIQAVFQDILKIGKYPKFELFVSLGTNDAGITEFIETFKDAALSFIDIFRNYLNQECEVHWLKPRGDNSSVRLTIANKLDEIALITSKVYLYNPLTSIGESGATYWADSVHPNALGKVNEGNSYTNKAYINT